MEQSISTRQSLTRSLALQLFLIGLTSVVVIVFPILYFGFPDGAYDQANHMRFAVSFQQSLSNDLSLPTWGSDNLGFGSVGVRFYPPIGSITMAAAYGLTGNWQSAFTLSMLFWMFVGAVGVYLFCREWIDSEYTVIGGIAFALIPYHLYQIFEYFLFAEFIALSILPYTFLFLSRLTKKASWGDAVLFGVSYSLLTLSHIPLSLIATLLLPVFTLALVEKKNLGKVLIRLCGSMFVWTVLSGFYWLKVIREYNWLAHTESKFTTAAYAFTTWLFPNSLSSRRFMETEMVALFFDIIIVLTLLFLIPGIIYLIMTAREKAVPMRRVLIALTGCGLVSFFMLSRLSTWVWETAPLLDKIQFPFRWLTLLSFFAVASFAIAIPLVTRLRKTLIRPAVYFSIALVFVVALYDLTQTMAQIAPMDETKFNQMVAELPQNTNTDPWWPVWAQRTAFENVEKVTAGNRVVDIAEWEATKRSFTIEEGSSGTIRIATFFYPFWQATLNGAPLALEKNMDGSIVFNAPQARSVVTLSFQEPWYYSLANWIGLLGWGGLLGIASFRLVGRRRFAARLKAKVPSGSVFVPDPVRPSQAGFSLVELLVVVIIIAIIAAIAIPSLLASRKAANESSAIATVRNVHSAQISYFSVYGGNQNYGDLSDLGSAGLLDQLIGGADTTSKSGYTFTVTRPAAAPYLLYCATGIADTFGETGTKDFLVSTDGVVFSTSTDGSMSCSDGVPDTTGGSPIQ